MKAIIGITPDYNYELQKYMISQYYVDAIKKAGGYPMALFDGIFWEIAHSHSFNSNSSLLGQISPFSTSGSSPNKSGKAVGKDFFVSAKSKDGLIEAIEHKTLPFVLGVQKQQTIKKFINKQ